MNSATRAFCFGRNALFALVLVAAAAQACAESVDGGVDAGSGARDVSPSGDSGVIVRYTFVLDDLSIDPTNDPSASHTGLDLDGLCSTAMESSGCFHRDSRSVDDPDLECAADAVGADGRCDAAARGCGDEGEECRGCVDNQAPTLAQLAQGLDGVSYVDALRQAIASGSPAVLVEVSRGADARDDAPVRVAVALGWPTVANDGGVGAHNRVFTLARTSLRPGGESMNDALIQLTGSVIDGRVRTTAASDVMRVPFPPIGGMAVTLPVRGFQMRFDFAPDALRRGDVGAWVGGDDLTAALFRDPRQHALFREAVAGVVDMPRADGTCDDRTSDRLGAVALGFGMHAIPARITSAPQ